MDAAQEAVHSRDSDVAAVQADVAAAKQNINAARSAVLSAQANVTAMRAGAVAGQASVRAAQATVTSSQANISRVATLKGFEQVLAPFNGVITARNVDRGTLIDAGSTGGGATDPTSTVPHTGLFGIARTDVLRVQVQVPQSSVSGIHVGQSADVLVHEFPGRRFTGIVARTAGALDAVSRTLLVEVHIPNPHNLLIPGMYAQIRFVTMQQHPLMVVPANTLVIDTDGTRLATVTPDNRVHYITVQLGRDFGKEVEIRQGLKLSDQLISNPTDDLLEGMTVKVVQPPKQLANH